MTNLRAFVLRAVLGLGSAAVTGCAGATAPPPTSTPSSRPTVTAPAPTSVRASAAPGRETWLDMFARGYFPGRSGQIFVVPREDDIITDRDPLYGFMHGSPWEYDIHIPLLLHGSPFVKPGTYDTPAVQQDVAPTLAASSARRCRPRRPAGRWPRRCSRAPGRASSSLLVLDAMRADYFDRYAAVMPTMSRLRREGAWFSNARINYLPTLTSVGHATLGTGTDPRVHGLAANNLFNRVTGKAQPAYDGLDPGS